MRAPGSPPPPEPPEPATEAGPKPWWRRWPTLAIGGALLAAAALVALTVVLATRAAPAVTTANAPPTPVPTAAPSPLPSPGASPEPGVDQQHFRTYVSTVLLDGTALTAATTQLHTCIASDRPGCTRALSDARARVNSFQSDLDANPPPSCLGDTDVTLRAGLGFYLKGIDLAEQGVSERDRLKLAQGGLLIGAGTFKTAQAVHGARTSSC